MERELLMTGIGGQGVQLAAQLLAKAATGSGRHVQLFGSYGGMMRGGNTDATLIIGDQPVEAPPMVSSAWSALVMHHEFAEPTLRRLRTEGLLVVNTSVVTSFEVHPSVQVLAFPASELALKLGAAAAATMTAAATTGIPMETRCQRHHDWSTRTPEFHRRARAREDLPRPRTTGARRAAARG